MVNIKNFLFGCGSDVLSKVNGPSIYIENKQKKVYQKKEVVELVSKFSKSAGHKVLWVGFHLLKIYVL